MGADPVGVIIRGAGSVFQARAGQQAIFTAIASRVYLHQLIVGIEDVQIVQKGPVATLDRNTMNCTIYEKRPLICREFEMGSYECIAERSVK